MNPWNFVKLKFGDYVCQKNLWGGGGNTVIMFSRFSWSDGQLELGHYQVSGRSPFSCCVDHWALWTTPVTLLLNCVRPLTVSGDKISEILTPPPQLWEQTFTVIWLYAIPASLYYYISAITPMGQYRSTIIRIAHSSGAVWESRWPSWAVRPNEPSGFRGRKDLLHRASALVTTCP